MKTNKHRAGVTLVEVMIAMFLVSIAAVIVYTEMMLSYRILMRSRARLEAQSIAFDRLWEDYNMPLKDISKLSHELSNEPTPEWSIMSTNGRVISSILAGGGSLEPIWWEIVVTVWAPTNTALQIGDEPLARAAVWRYRGVRCRGDL